MSFASRLLLPIALIVAAAGMPVFAAEPPSLFLNLTTDNSQRSETGLIFARDQMARGHALTVLLNDQAVRMGSSTNLRNFVNQQKLLRELMGKGAVVLVCRVCMRHYGVTEASLMQGMQLDDPQRVGEALFRDNTRSLTW
ncbi:DsrE family protein [Methyloversatilis sp.]|uniref:DsrE family protein n=1 Tax=Methyloversatilis sp. TaxID=2569862 RepID=UPI002736B4B8|nr:DsrE family protein [Methyloversatilis sp.]MDP2868156.1 DsrE family protein [Methyloversatilis sp.]MDP3457376.1 DsrE family protein [Methyloversatilis sp.]MDP3578674.1 DsrE family protein [Methyloversatilis sp.]